MKKFQSPPFPQAEPPKLSQTRSFFTPFPAGLWDGIFKIPEALRKLFPKPKAPAQPEREPRKPVGHYRTRRKLKFQIEVLAYPLRPRASHIPLRGELVNLSNNGVCVEFLKDIEANHLFLLDFRMPEEKSVRLPARVIWSRNRLSGFELLSATLAKKMLKETRSA